MTEPQETRPLHERFAALFGDLNHVNRIGAFGTGEGRWVKRPMDYSDVIDHIEGRGPGIGIPPLGPDNKVWFAAIDLDEPDFEAAREMQEYLPGRTWLERSRSGNAHIWAFFKEPLEAWVAMGILKEATLAAGKSSVEVFPKNHDFAKVKYGNYINLPYHGTKRPILEQVPPEYLSGGGFVHKIDDSNFLVPTATFERWLEAAEKTRLDPENWRKRARWLMLEPPENRERNSEHGTGKELHRCAEYIIANRDDNPVVEGHRNGVFFALAKMLSHYEGFDHDEAFMMMELVNDASPDPAPESELKRILANAERGGYTSTDCDNPLVAPYADPNCPIANPRRK